MYAGFGIDYSFDGNQNQPKKEVKFKCQENVKKIFSKRNGLAEVTENDSYDTLVLDNDAHRVNLHSCSYFFCMR